MVRIYHRAGGARCPQWVRGSCVFLSPDAEDRADIPGTAASSTSSTVQRLPKSLPDIPVLCYSLGMSKQLLISVLVVLSSGMPSLACSPDPEFQYDEISSQVILIATATVTAFDLEDHSRQSCWRVSYSNASYLYGKGEEEFSVTTCAQENEQIDLQELGEELLDDLGFVQGAEVLVGLVQNDKSSPELRYAIPSCWGPLHINLSNLSSNEREGLLQEVRSQLVTGEQ